MAGGLFAVDRKYFFEIGGYDPGLQIWGGENFEISFKVCSIFWIDLNKVSALGENSITLEFSTCSTCPHVERSYDVENMTKRNSDQGLAFPSLYNGLLWRHQGQRRSTIRTISWDFFWWGHVPHVENSRHIEFHLVLRACLNIFRCFLPARMNLHSSTFRIGLTIPHQMRSLIKYYPS